MGNAGYIPLTELRVMTTFLDLVDSRKAWIETVLRPWCRQAPRRELLKAEQEWLDIAGKVAPDFTLWLWAWERFPVLCVDGLKGLDETFPVEVTLKTGEKIQGYPDSRESRRGELFLVTLDGAASGPHLLDDIQSVSRAG
jgi:hypothetical protein